MTAPNFNAVLIKNSRSLHQVHYNKRTQELQVWFKSNLRTPYLYPGVPESVYLELLRADSPGKFFNDNIRDVYSTVKKVA